MQHKLYQSNYIFAILYHMCTNYSVLNSQLQTHFFGIVGMQGIGFLLVLDT